MVSLRGRPRTRREPLACVGRLDQVAGVQLVEAGDGAERGVRLLRSTTGSGFGFEVLVGRGFDVGRAWLGGQPLAWWSPAGLIGPWLHDPAGISWFRGFQVGVDGGVPIANAAEIASWGADVLVGGSAICDGIDPPATCAACSTSCVPQLASRTPPLAEEEAHVHQRHTPDRPAANPYEDHPDRRGSP
jgi:hypothetical protein